MSPILQRLNDEAADVIETARRSLVQIRNHVRGAGAGTVWHPDGLILTNAHVVREGPLRVELADGRVLPARMLARSDALDLAALGVDAKGLPVMGLGQSKLLRSGQPVMAVGHPWGVVGAATAGVVIGVGQHWPEGTGSEREWIGVNLNLDSLVKSLCRSN